MNTKKKSEEENAWKLMNRISWVSLCSLFRSFYVFAHIFYLFNLNDSRTQGAASSLCTRPQEPQRKLHLNVREPFVLQNEKLLNFHFPFLSFLMLKRGFRWKWGLKINFCFGDERSKRNINAKSFSAAKAKRFRWESRQKCMKVFRRKNLSWKIQEDISY